jgi:hypothetical protein
MPKVCNARKSYGKTAPVPCEENPRRFPALFRANKKFELTYKGRTTVKRVNVRVKICSDVYDYNLTGSRPCVAQVRLVLAVEAVFTTLLARARRGEATLGKMGLSPIAKALQANEKSQG